MSRAKPVTLEEELTRLQPVLPAVIAMGTPVSIDTMKPEVALWALGLGASIVNDVWGLQRDPNMARVVAGAGVPVICMHNRYKAEQSINIMSDINAFFTYSIDVALKAGILRDCIVLDPGIGFGKTPEQSMESLAKLEAFRRFKLPILVGASRKRFVSALDVDRDAATAAISACSAGDQQSASALPRTVAWTCSSDSPAAAPNAVTCTPHSYSQALSAQVRSITISRSRKESGPRSSRLPPRNFSHARGWPAIVRNSTSGGLPRMMRSKCAVERPPHRADRAARCVTWADLRARWGAATVPPGRSRTNPIAPCASGFRENSVRR